MPLLSIIIPVYNAEKYISTCIDSIRNQTFSDFELILVDDGSTDSCGMICDDYRKLDSRIKVLHQANLGVSAARNRGIEEARGQFVAMVDSDDTLDKDMYSILINTAISNDVDLVICGIEEVCGDKVIVRNYNLPDNQVLNENDIINRVIASDFTSENIINSPCNKLYKRELIESQHLQFPSRVRGEDWLFNIDYLQVAKSVIYIDRPLYHYYRHDESAMSKFLPNQFDLWLENREVRQKLLNKYRLNVDIKAYNRIWIEKVFNYLAAKNNRDYSLILTILKNQEFKKACKNSNILRSKVFDLARVLIGLGLWPLVIPILLIIKIYKNYNV